MKFPEGESHPGKKVTTYAYVNYSTPPIKEKIDPNVVGEDQLADAEILDGGVGNDRAGGTEIGVCKCLGFFLFRGIDGHGLAGVEVSDQ